MAALNRKERPKRSLEGWADLLAVMVLALGALAGIAWALVSDWKMTCILAGIAFVVGACLWLIYRDDKDGTELFK